MAMTTDSTGVYHIDPEAVPHTYGYDGSGNLLTDTMVFGGPTFVKTYGWAGAKLVAEGAWVKQ